MPLFVSMVRKPINSEKEDAEFLKKIQKNKMKELWDNKQDDSWEKV